MIRTCSLLLAAALTVAVAAQPAETYIWRTESVAAIGPQADPLRAELEAHTLELISSGNAQIDGGLLQPALFRPGLAGEFLVYGAPSETLLFLSDISSVLGPPTRAALLDYLDTLLAEFPPLERSFVHGDGFWGFVPMERNRREYYPMPPTAVNIWPPPQVPLDALYALWRYADATGDWSYVRARLPALQALYNEFTPPATRFGEILGLIGAARIAEREGLLAWRNAAVAQAVAAIDAADYVAWADAAQLAFTRPTHDWCYPLFHFMRADIPVGVSFGPELGRLLRDRFQSACSAHAGLRIGGPGPDEHARGSLPGWMAVRGQFCDNGYIYKGGVIPGWGTYMQGGENNYSTPDFSWTFFLLRAWVFEDEPQHLAAWTDAPVCIGDLCHLHKLAVAMRSFGQTRWRSVRGGNLDNDVDVDAADLGLFTLCLTGPDNFVTPACAESDLSGDHDADLDDFAVMQVAVTGPR
jgi:hypothetical protein